MDEGNGTPYIVTQVLRIVEPGHHQSHLGDAVMAINYRFNCTFNRTINCCQRQNSHHIAPGIEAMARRGERARARVVHRPPLTGFTSGVQEVHLLSRLRSSSIPGTELSIDSLALIVGFKFF